MMIAFFETTGLREGGREAVGAGSGIIPGDWGKDRSGWLAGPL